MLISHLFDIRLSTICNISQIAQLLHNSNTKYEVKGPIVGLKDRRKEEGEEDRETIYSRLFLYA